MVNGAGLAMATNGTSSSMPAAWPGLPRGAEEVCRGSLGTRSRSCERQECQGVLINIFGGILRVDTLATGVVEPRENEHQAACCVASKASNVNEGEKKILMESGFTFVVAELMKDAADKVVAAARGA